MDTQLIGDPLDRARGVVAGSLRASNAIRVARFRSSSLYFLGAAMTLIILPRIESLHQTRGDSLHREPGDGVVERAGVTRAVACPAAVTTPCTRHRTRGASASR
jgi:hypothetical protein